MSVDVNVKLQLVEEDEVAEPTDPGPLGVMRQPQVGLEPVELGEGVGAAGAGKDLVAVVQVVGDRLDAFKLGVANATDDLGGFGSRVL